MDWDGPGGEFDTKEFLHALIFANISNFYSFGLRSVSHLAALETFQTRHLATDFSWFPCA